MPNLTITVPASGAVVTRVSAIAQARHAAKFNPPSSAPVVTDLAAVKELLVDYLISLYQADVTNTSAATAQATVTTATAQALTDAAAVIT